MQKLISKKFIGWLCVTGITVSSIVFKFDVTPVLINWWGWITISWVSGQSVIDVIKSIKSSQP